MKRDLSRPDEKARQLSENNMLLRAHEERIAWLSAEVIRLLTMLGLEPRIETHEQLSYEDTMRRRKK